MVKSLENGISLPPFLVKCYEMVSDESTNDLISWSESKDSFVIYDESRFSSQLLPKYFKHGNFSSFVRQLNIYGFRKVDTDRWQFANEAFVSGQKHLLRNITRRKQQQLQSSSSSQRKSLKEEIDELPPQPSEENDDKRAALWKEVEILKTDKNALTQQLKKLRQHQQNSQSKVLLLTDQLNGMEKNQQQMLSFIVMVMQRPEFILQFVQTKENGWHLAENANANKLSEVTDDCVSSSPSPSPPPDGTIVPYQPPNSLEAPPPQDSMDLDLDLDLDLDFSSYELRDLLDDSDFFTGLNEERLNSLNLDFPTAENNPEKLLLADAPENDEMLDRLLSWDPSEDDDE
ncbi:hypothetical protein M569_03842, partial [Genlisea aurea]